MTKYTALGLFGLGMLVSPLWSARGDAPVRAGTRLGIINIEETLSASPAGKRANAAFEATRTAKQARLDEQQAALKAADAELVKQKATLAPAVFETKRQELERQLVDLQQTYTKLERELAQDRTKIIQDLLKSAEPKMAEIARSEGVQVILDQSATVWADPAVDLTAKLDAQMK